METMQIANEIVSQIHASTKIEIGAREFVGGGNKVHFRVNGRNRKVVIELNGLDLYDVQVVKFSRNWLDMKVEKEICCIDAERINEWLLNNAA